MRPSSMTDREEGRGSPGRGGRQLTDWVLECLQEFGSTIQTTPEGGWRVKVGPGLVRPLGRREIELSASRDAQANDGREPIIWENDVVQRLLAHARDLGQTARIWLRGADPAEGLGLVEARLEIEGVTPRLRAVRVVPRPFLTYNFKVGWRGTEGREELRCFRFVPETGLVGEIPPADQYDYAEPPAGEFAEGPALPVRDGFEQTRARLEGAIAEKLGQRQRRAGADHREEEARLNAYYSQLMKEERPTSARRGEKRAAERVEQLKREWRQKLDALAGSKEEARYELLSAAVVQVPWLEVEITVPGRPRLIRTTFVNLHLKRWDGLACEACGKTHVELKRDGARLVGIGEERDPGGASRLT